ncbi:ribonuclease E inhibitor RraB [Acinetobacter gerneri]|uniref:Regulator of ribonuclease activity B domain-containing protein n=2 Tax=Acinetobacter gerneri TaxID=202952 RepID=N8ZTA8_9GAMM|nr:ribonuclease E inhibitor RraB [Acinetobacter gerneri]ENV34978.1 hypothetical protein F960_00949 [Acinetobacter gerneri DSM 14967 = CIP 107464 = MTCC 9824]MDQ9009883.1 ribonuclease E inhibitor RraB [Acinetobacter gerneri]MDQ9014197.1 ribonuclease E inhibitor RraB [Acinetobacter gerneri]MDQ9025161.1 ribonuclease E inhibitor RraB [Acinetobacter gerneri]MDQ9050704.1 ribonuclease E inhibitor RraB [Acinetobacter gerneri]
MMNLRFFNKFLIIFTLLFSTISTAQEYPITKKSLIVMFNNIKKNTDWDMSKPMLWGYFFTDNHKEKLEDLAQILKKNGYDIVDIYLSDKDTPNEPDLWWLHVEKVEIHTPKSLYNRNIYLYQLAENNNIESYDGMDVGLVSDVQTTH